LIIRDRGALFEGDSVEEGPKLQLSALKDVDLPGWYPWRVVERGRKDKMLQVGVVLAT
jgi:hypothetical protein